MKEKYRHWKLKVGDINPNDPRWDKADAELLERALSVLAMKTPAVCEVVEKQPVGIYEYNYDCGNTRIPTLTLTPNQCTERHEYHAAPAVWFRPGCDACRAEFEEQCEKNPENWHRKSTVTPKFFGRGKGGSKS